MVRREIFRLVGKGAIAAFALAVLYRVRVIQVGIFGLTAALRSWRVGMRKIPEAIVFPSLGNDSPKMPQAKGVELNPRVLVTYHPEYHSYSPQMALASVEYLRRLGAGWLRSDIRWYNLFPEGDKIDKKALAWYKGFLADTVSAGLRNMVVLSSPSRIIKAQPISQRLISWNNFVDAVVSELAGYCHAYQLMNEPNNPVYSIFGLQETAEAFEKGAFIVRKNVDAPIALNISLEFWGWKRYLQQLLGQCRDAIDIIGLDHYPQTWTVGMNAGWTAILSIARLASEAVPGSVWHRKKVAILETGYSMNLPSRSQAAQAEYFRDLLPVAQQLISLYPHARTPLLGIYELVDGSTRAVLDPEAHFGLLETNLKEKDAFGAVKSLITEMNAGGSKNEGSAFISH